MRLLFQHVSRIKANLDVELPDSGPVTIMPGTRDFS